MADIRLRPGTTIGSLVVRKLIPSWEKGGMAYVVLVSPIDNSDVHYALKIAKRDKEGTSLNYNALELEARLLGKLDHQGIVKLAALPQSDSQRDRKKPKQFWAYANEFRDRPPYFIMDYLEGGTLTDVLNRSGKKEFTFSSVVAFAYKLADALTYLHQQNYFHNDLKPNNIMFKKTGNTDSLPDPVLIDFGISTTKGASYLDGFTAHYAAPEKLLHAIDSSYKPPEGAGWMKVDVWGLGVILYQMLTMKYPYHGSDPNSLITTIRTKRPEPISNFRKKVPKEIEEIILDGCLCFEVRNRMSSQDVTKQLEAML